MDTTQRKYLSYLLRLWQVEEKGHPAWRASLEDPHTGERRGFSSVELLIEFLLQIKEGNDEEQNRRQREQRG